MSFLTKYRPGLRATFQASILILIFGGPFPEAIAQLTNGVFDPSKVMIAKDKLKEVQSIEQNISLAREFNRTLGTPSHPRPQVPVASGPPETREPGNSNDVPSFDLPPEVEQRNQARAKARKIRENPSVVANKLEKPSVSANPIPVPIPVPVPEPEEPAINSSPVEMASNRETGKPGFFTRFKRSTDLPPSGVSMNGELDVIPPDAGLASVQESEGELVPLDGDVVLPSISSSPNMNPPQKSGFLSMFSKPRKRSLDVPDREIPISIGSANAGNPYSSDQFHPGSEYSPLFDDASQIRDMTRPGALPIGNGGEGIAARHTRKPAKDVSQYMIVKSDTMFEPFKYGTEEVDKENAFELYSGSTVRDLGIVGLKRMIQIDSGETGMVPKSSLRQLAVSEEVLLSNGISGGRPWYSVLDTEPEMNELASSLSAKMATGPKPQRPWGADKPRKLENGKPDSDTSQYYIVRRKGVTFAPFGADGEEIDLISSFEIPPGAMVKVITTPGSNHIVETESGESGVLPTDGVRQLNDSEKVQMTGGLSQGRPWYSILDTDADAATFVAAVKPSPAPVAMPPIPKAAPIALPKKPESEISQYFIVKKEGVLFQPFRGGTQEVDPKSSFEMYSGAVLRVLSTLNDSHIVQTDSNETGKISTSGLRPLTSVEREQMASGISKGRPWYSILDTAPAE